MQKKNVVLEEKANAFALRVVKMYQFLVVEKKEYVMSKQILRSGTSIGASIAESQGALTTSDFSFKISISYKEALETKYWLKLLYRSGYIEKKSFQSMHNDADELCKIIFSILKTTKRINRTSKI